MPLYVHVNIVGEWSGVHEDMAQAYLQHFDNINCLLAKHNLPAFLEPDYSLEWDEEDSERQYMTSFPCECLVYLRRALILRRHVRTLWSMYNSCLHAQKLKGFNVCVVIMPSHPVRRRFESLHAVHLELEREAEPADFFVEQLARVPA